MTVHEPATLLTDYVLVVLAGFLAWRLRRDATGSLAVRWWSRTLGLTALAAFIGGSYHGFAPNFPAPVAAAWWVAALWSMNLLSAAMALSLLHVLRPLERQRRWRVVIGCKLVMFAGLALVQPMFLVAIIDYGSVLLLWAAAAMVGRGPWRGWMLAGVALSVVAAAVQQLGWGPAPQFNHNDLYHVIQAVALLAFYRAGRKLPPRPPRSAQAG